MQARLDSRVWPLTPLYADFDFDAYDFLEVFRQSNPDMLRAFDSLRAGKSFARWGNPAVEYTARDYFEEHCSGTTPGNAGLIASRYDMRHPTTPREYVTQAAVDKGYVTLVATNIEASEACDELRRLARLKAGSDWASVTFAAIDHAIRKDIHGNTTYTEVAVRRERDGKSSGIRAPDLSTFYEGQHVAAACTTKALDVMGVSHTLPSSRLGVVVSVQGRDVRDAVICVQFVADKYYPNDTFHVFEAEHVVSPDGLHSRYQVQLREGAFMSIHRAQAIGIQKLVVDCYGINGGTDFIRGLLYTGVSRADMSCAGGSLILINMSYGVNLSYAEALQLTTDRAQATTRAQAVARLASDSAVVVRSVAAWLTMSLRNADAGAVLANELVLRLGDKRAREPVVAQAGSA
jgi:hypothetical protein